MKKKRSNDKKVKMAFSDQINAFDYKIISSIVCSYIDKCRVSPEEIEYCCFKAIDWNDKRS